MTGRKGKPAAGRSPADLEATLNGCWVVLILDPEPDTVASTGFAVLTAMKVPLAGLTKRL